MRSKTKLTTAVLGTAAIVALWPSSASAHHPEVSVSSICVDGSSSLLTVHAEAWSKWDDGTPVTADRRYNSNVTVDMMNGSLQDTWIPIGTGHFSPDNSFSFDVSTVQPDNVGVVTVRVTSSGNWGPNGEYPSDGDTRTATIDLSDDCGPVVVTTSVVPTTTSSPKITTTSTTVGPGSGESVVIERRPTAAVPVEGTPRFAG